MWEKVHLPVDSLRTGDLIVRLGRGFVSDALLSFSTKNPEYSHSGILEVENNGKVYVYHAIGGEENVSNKAKKERIELFCHPSAVHKFAIFRYDLPDSVLQDFVGRMRGYYDAGMEFDLDFDMNTLDKMYCSEMIYYAMDSAMKGNSFLQLSHVLEKPYMAIDDLYLNDYASPIFKYDYEKKK